MSKYYISEGKRLARPLLDPSLLQSPNMKNQKIQYKNVKILNIMLCLVLNGYICTCHTFYELCTTLQENCKSQSICCVFIKIWDEHESGITRVHF